MGSNLINPNAVPRPTGAPRQDMDAMFRFLFGLVGELAFELGDAKRRLAALEDKGTGGRKRMTGGQ